MILDDIVAHKKTELARWRKSRPLAMLRNDVLAAPPTRDFRRALAPSAAPCSSQPLRVIAEIKKASPSKGVLRRDFNPVAIAKTYEAGGAAAISVLTDSRFFEGSMEYLSQVRVVTTIPLLMKDFIIDPYQLYQARIYGADAVLLIAAILSAEQLSEYLSLANSLTMSALVEVHTDGELSKALAANAEIVGINNRDLRTFQVTVATTSRLASSIGPGRIVVSESGIDSREAMLSLAEQGVHAFLIGEALMRSKDIRAALQSLLN